MRALVLLLILLAGCASPTEPEVDHEEPLYGVIVSPERIEDTELTNATWGNDTSRHIADGTVQWHGDLTSPLNAYSQVAQVIAHPCAWEPREVYFTNQLVGAFEVPYGTDEVGITFSWDVTNTPSTQLRAAWRSGDNDYAETAPFAPDTEFRIPQDVTDWQDDYGPFTGASWELWACLPDGTNDTASLYIGDLSYAIDAYRLD